MKGGAGDFFYLHDNLRLFIYIFGCSAGGGDFWKVVQERVGFGFGWLLMKLNSVELTVTSWLRGLTVTSCLSVWCSLTRSWFCFLGFVFLVGHWQMFMALHVHVYTWDMQVQTCNWSKPNPYYISHYISNPIIYHVTFPIPY